MSFRPNRDADFEAGLFFTLFGSLTAGLSLQYQLGTVASMGPGMFPLMLGVMLTIIGLVIFTKSFFHNGEDARKIPLAPAVLVTLSLLVFALLGLSLGLIVAVPVQVIIALWASEHFTWKRAIALSASILAFCYVVFVHLLGIAMPMFAGV